MRLFIIFALLLTVTTSNWVFAFSDQVGDNSIKSCNDSECKAQFRRIKKFAKNGSADAQSILASMYLNGYGIESDRKKAFKWLNRASKLGGSPYRNQLASFYLKGIGTEQDIEKGVELLHRSVQNKNSEAAFLLGLFYGAGKYVGVNRQKSHDYLFQSAKLGNTKALLLLGEIYEKGTFGQVNVAQAVEFYKVAAETEPKAKARLDQLKTSGVDSNIIFPDDIEYERVTVTAPPLNEAIDIAINSIYSQKVFNGRKSGSNIPGRSCVTERSCLVVGGSSAISNYINASNYMYASALMATFSN